MREWGGARLRAGSTAAANSASARAASGLPACNSGQPEFREASTLSAYRLRGTGIHGKQRRGVDEVGVPVAAAGLCGVRGVNTWRMSTTLAPRKAASFPGPRTLHEDAMMCALSERWGELLPARASTAMCASALRGHHLHCPHGDAAARE